METIVTTIVRDLLRELPREGVDRELALRRAAELSAEAEASAALNAATLRARDASQHTQTGNARMLADVLSATNAVWPDRVAAPSADRLGAWLALRQEIASAPFLQLVADWITELREIAGSAPRTGACTVASAMQLWLWTMVHFTNTAERRESVVAELADAFCSLIAARCQIVSVVRELDASTLPRELRQDLCHVQGARAAGTVATLCADLVHGYRRHPAWDIDECSGCYGAEELDELEGLMPGIASAARAHSDVIEADGSHPPKAGPCVRVADLQGFTRLRTKLDGCLTGARLAKDRAAFALAPEAVRS